MRIGKIARSAEYQMDKQFANFWNFDSFLKLKILRIH